MDLHDGYGADVIVCEQSIQGRPPSLLNRPAHGSAQASTQSTRPLIAKGPKDAQKREAQKRHRKPYC